MAWIETYNGAMNLDNASGFVIQSRGNLDKVLVKNGEDVGTVFEAKTSFYNIPKKVIRGIIDMAGERDLITQADISRIAYPRTGGEGQNDI